MRRAVPRNGIGISIQSGFFCKTNAAFSNVCFCGVHTRKNGRTRIFLFNGIPFARPQVRRKILRGVLEKQPFAAVDLHGNLERALLILFALILGYAVGLGGIL